MQRYKIKIEYDGTSFVGWQFQKNGLSIQEVLQNALFDFSKEKITILLAERKVKELEVLDFIALLKSCEFARYTPTSDVMMKQDYEKAIEVISNIDKQIQ